MNLKDIEINFHHCKIKKCKFLSQNHAKKSNFIDKLNKILNFEM